MIRALANGAEFKWDDFCQRSSVIIFRYPLKITDSPAPGMTSMKTEGLWVIFDNDHHWSGDGCTRVRFGQHVLFKVREVDDYPPFFQGLMIEAEKCRPRECWCVG